MDKSKFTNLTDIITNGYQKLINAKIINAKQEIIWFLKNKFSIQLIDIKINKNKKLSYKKVKIFNQFINRRAKGEPFQYIINNANFFGYDFFVESGVFIPRPETELIINVAAQYKPFHKAIDIGTGSGNIAIVLSLQKIAKKIHAIDISQQALNIAKHNNNKYNLNNISFFISNFLEETKIQQYDLIVSNPPYITKKEYVKLDKSIKSFEPKIALTDNKDGLTFYKFYATKLIDVLKPKGKIIIEIGLENQKDIIENLFIGNGLRCIWHKDLNDNYRVAELYK